MPGLLLPVTPFLREGASSPALNTNDSRGTSTVFLRRRKFGNAPVFGRDEYNARAGLRRLANLRALWLGESSENARRVPHQMRVRGMTSRAPAICMLASDVPQL